MDLGGKKDGEGQGHSCVGESLPSPDEATHFIQSNWGGVGGAESLYLLFLSLKLNEVSFKNQTFR